MPRGQGNPLVYEMEALVLEWTTLDKQELEF